MLFVSPLSMSRMCRVALLVAVSLFFALTPSRAKAWYVGLDGIYGGLGTDTLVDDFFVIIGDDRPPQHGGGARFVVGLGKKWATEFSVGFQQGRRYVSDSGQGGRDQLRTLLLQTVDAIDSDQPFNLTLTQLSGGARRIEEHYYLTIGVEGRYFVLGDFAYDPDVPNDFYFGVGGTWAIPSFWEGSDYLSAIPSLKVTTGYTRRITRSLFMDFGVEIFALPTPPSNIINGKVGLKYNF